MYCPLRELRQVDRQLRQRQAVISSNKQEASKGTVVSGWGGEAGKRKNREDNTKGLEISKGF